VWLWSCAVAGRSWVGKAWLPEGEEQHNHKSDWGVTEPYWYPPHCVGALAPPLLRTVMHLDSLQS
jgi:hypothetical protein